MCDYTVQYDAGTYVDYDVHLAPPFLEHVRVLMLNHGMNLHPGKPLESPAKSLATILAIIRNYICL